MCGHSTKVLRVVETIIREVIDSKFPSDVCVNTINVVTCTVLQINYCYQRELRISMMKIEEHLYAYITK